MEDEAYTEAVVLESEDEVAVQANEIIESAPTGIPPRNSCFAGIKSDGTKEFYRCGVLVCRIYDNGSFEKYDDQGRLHSDSGPAVRNEDGTYEYWTHGANKTTTYFAELVAVNGDMKR